MTIFILIPIHNRLKTTIVGLNSLYRSLNFYTKTSNCTIKFKVVVIDDGSTDGSYEWISENYPDINLVKGDGNLWWTGAINLGIKYVLKNFNSISGFLFWNDDTTPAEDYINRLSELSEKKSNTIIGNIVLEKENHDVIHSYGGSLNKWTGFIHYNYKGYSIKSCSDNETYVDWLPGMGTYIPIEVFNKIGFLDDKHFPSYFGDVDYCLSAKKSDFKLLVNTNLIIFNDSKLTGLVRPQKLTDFKALFFSNRSKYNLKQNFMFAFKHGYFPFSLIGFIRNYFFFFRDSIKILLKKSINPKNS